MKIFFIALLMSGALLGLALPKAHADGESQVPALPEAYDLTALSRHSSTATTGLEPFKKINDDTTNLSVIPSTGDGADTRIEWSGQVSTSVVYQNKRTKRSTEFTQRRPSSPTPP